MTEFNDLIPEMRDWNNGSGIDINDWIACSGNFRLAIGYSAIFWPRFVEFENYVLREGFTVENLREYEKHCAGDRARLEGLMNRLNLVALQYWGCEDLTRERIVYLGQILREIYEAKLAWQFPQRRFEVHFDDSDCEDLTDYQVIFHQIAK